MKYILKERAKRDVDYHWHYIDERNPGAANRFLQKFFQTCDLLESHPEIGHQEGFRRGAGIRSWRIEGFENYLVFYRAKKSHLEILRVLHGARNLPRFFRSS